MSAQVMVMNPSSGSWTTAQAHGAVLARVGRDKSIAEQIRELRACFPELLTVWWGERTWRWWAVVRGVDELIEARDLDQLGRQLWAILRAGRGQDLRLLAQKRPGPHRVDPRSPRMDPRGPEYGPADWPQQQGEPHRVNPRVPPEEEEPEARWVRRQLIRMGLVAA